MRDQKFRYFFKKPTGSIIKHFIDIQHLEHGKLALFMEHSYILMERDLIARDSYTGLKDSKGIEQYEGDIKDFGMYSNKEYGRCLHVIYWDEESAGFYTRELGFQKQDGFPLGGEDYEGEIIGNLTENPELMETIK